MPFVCLGIFLIKTRDPFGPSVALWRTAESFMDIAPYIDDARAMDRRSVESEEYVPEAPQFLHRFYFLRLIMNADK